MTPETLEKTMADPDFMIGLLHNLKQLLVDEDMPDFYLDVMYRLKRAERERQEREEKLIPTGRR